MIAEGTYIARAISMIFSKSSQKGTPFVAVAFRIESDGPEKNAIQEWQGWLSDKAEARTAESIRICGYDGENESSISRNQVSITVEHEEYPENSGNKRPRIRWINDPTRAAAQAVDGATAMQMKERLKGLIMAQNAANPPKANGADFPHGANVAPQAPAAPAQAGFTPKF